MSNDPAKCPFCEVGQYNRILMWRIVKGLSRSQLKQLIKERREKENGKS